MILVDTSIWIDHLRGSDEHLSGLLAAGRVLIHPYVLGEVALGNLKNRAAVLGAMSDLTLAVAATDDEVLRFIDARALKAKLYSKFSCSPCNEVTDGILFSCGNNEVFRSVLLQHHPLHPDIVLCVPPIPFRIKVPKKQAFT